MFSPDDCAPESLCCPAHPNFGLCSSSPNLRLQACSESNLKCTFQNIFYLLFPLEAAACDLGERVIFVLPFTPSRHPCLSPLYPCLHRSTPFSGEMIQGVKDSLCSVHTKVICGGTPTCLDSSAGEANIGGSLGLTGQPDKQRSERPRASSCPFTFDVCSLSSMWCAVDEEIVFMFSECSGYILNFC